MFATMKNTTRGLFIVLLSATLLACSHAKAPVATAGSAAGTAPAAAAAADTGAGASSSAGAAPAAPAGSAAPQGSAGAAAPLHPDVILLAGTALAACVLPTPPAAVPDGKVATRAQMITAHTQTANYNSATNTYIACLDTAQLQFERQYGSVLAPAGQRDIAAMSNHMHNAAIDADQLVANKFNQQLRIYKARGGVP
jgi:hypothetical protein